MSLFLRHCRRLPTVTVALVFGAPVALETAFAQSIARASVLESTSTTAPTVARRLPFTLRMDNYVDVVDSVLNARVRTRRSTRRASVDTAAAATPDPVRERIGSFAAREDSLLIRRSARRSRLPADPLVVQTTAAFTGTGAPAGAATWPPASGRLSISADDGSRIDLDADTGDIASVSVTLVSGAETYRFREPWVTWAPLVFNDR